MTVSIDLYECLPNKKKEEIKEKWKIIINPYDKNEYVFIPKEWIKEYMRYFLIKYCSPLKKLIETNKNFDKYELISIPIDQIMEKLDSEFEISEFEIEE